MRRFIGSGLGVATAVALLASPPAVLAQRLPAAPGAPGARATWAPADKHGFGTARQRASHLRLEAGAPVEQPRIVDCRYVRADC